MELTVLMESTEQLDQQDQTELMVPMESTERLDQQDQLEVLTHGA
jgi:hypothetical protein